MSFSAPLNRLQNAVDNLIKEQLAQDYLTAAQFKQLLEGIITEELVHITDAPMPLHYSEIIEKANEEPGYPVADALIKFDNRLQQISQELFESQQRLEQALDRDKRRVDKSIDLFGVVSAGVLITAIALAIFAPHLFVSTVATICLVAFIAIPMCVSLGFAVHDMYKTDVDHRVARVRLRETVLADINTALGEIVTTITSSDGLDRLVNNGVETLASTNAEEWLTKAQTLDKVLGKDFLGTLCNIDRSAGVRPSVVAELTQDSSDPKRNFVSVVEEFQARMDKLQQINAQSQAQR